MIKNDHPIKEKLSQVGQGMVEFALILPLLLLLLWGILEFGRLLFVYTEVSNASREAVRFAVVRGIDLSGGPRYVDCDGIREAANQATVLTRLEASNVEIGYDRGGGPIFTGCPPTEPVGFGNRVVITVTYDIRPVVLFQSIDPFKVQFTSARTIVQQGISMEGVGDKPAVPETGPPGSPELRLVLDQDACLARFEWDAVTDTDGYRLFQTVPTPTVQVNGDITATLYYPHPISMTVTNGEEFYLRGYNDAGSGPFSNIVSIGGCSGAPSQPTNLAVIDRGDDPCFGYFIWDVTPGATSYRFFSTSGGQLGGDLTTECYSGSAPCPSDPGEGVSLGNGEEFVVRAYNEFGPSLPSDPVVVDFCYPNSAPLAPTNFTFEVDEQLPYCRGHFEWNTAIGSQGYRVYQMIPPFTMTQLYTSTPSYADEYPFSGEELPLLTDGEEYFVRAYNQLGESPASNTVMIGGCTPGPEQRRFFLHTSSVSCANHDGSPPLTMDEEFPLCWGGPYDYDGGDGDPAGRLLLPGGTPFGEADLSKHLAWVSNPLPYTMEMQAGSASLKIWYINPDNGKDLDLSAYLCVFNGGYSNCIQATGVMGKSSPNWTELNLTWAGGLPEIPRLGQLALYLVQDGGPQGGLPAWLLYDSQPYPSLVSLTGTWKWP